MKAFMQRKLQEVRETLGATRLTDEAAMEVIIRSVFDDEEAERFSGAQLRQAIDKLFYQTRCQLGILQPLLAREDVSEIMVNGPTHIFVETQGEIHPYALTFDSAEEVEEILRTIAAQVHREINELHPILDARLADGSRVNGVYRNVAVNGPILTIRKFSGQYMTMDSLIAEGTVNREGAALLAILVACRYNLFISGGTSSGKTTLLNALADYIPPAERVIVIEDSSELKLQNLKNIVHLECRNNNALGRGQVTMAQLIKSSLRMRPDRIIVGEVRGGEVLDMLQAMNTGHAGSLSTGHGNSVEGMLQRLETLYLMAMPLTIEAVRAQIAQAIDVMVHVERMEDGQRRVVEITEVLGEKEGDYQLNRLMIMGENHRLERIGTLRATRKARLKGGDYADKLRALGFFDEG